MNKKKLDGLPQALKANLLKRKEQKNNLKNQKQKLRKNKIGISKLLKQYIKNNYGLINY